jgi:hypothetical protein
MKKQTKQEQISKPQLSKNDLYWITILIVGAVMVALMSLLIICKLM